MLKNRVEGTDEDVSGADLSTNGCESEKKN